MGPGYAIAGRLSSSIPFYYSNVYVEHLNTRTGKHGNELATLAPMFF